MALAVGLAALTPATATDDVPGAATPITRTVMTQLNEPRGLLVAADGSICVAEAGYIDEHPVDAERVGRIDTETGSVSCLRPNGVTEQIVEGIAYVNYPTTGVSTGAADIAQLEDRFFVLVGESFGAGSRTLSEIRGGASGLAVVADLLAFAREQTPEGVTDGLILSNPFAMAYQEDPGRFLVTDGATGHVLSVGLDGSIDVFSRVEGHHVLTGIALDPAGAVHVTSFSPLPHPKGGGSVLRLDDDGRAHPVVEGLTMPIDLAFDSAGRLLVLEFAGGSEDDPYGGGAGRVLRLSPSASGWSSADVLLDGLEHPTSLAFLDDDALLITVRGAFTEPGAGQVVELRTR